MKKIWPIIRILIALLIIYLLLRKINLKSALILLLRVDPLWLSLAFLAFFLFVFISVIRWKILLDAKELFFSNRYLLKVYFISLFFNNLLPTAIGGDVMRVAYTNKKKEGGISQALAVTFFDRVIGFVGLFAFALITTFLFFLFRNPGGGEYLTLNLFGFLLLFALTALLISDQAYRLFRRVWLKLKFWRLGEKIDSFAAKLKDFAKNLSALFSSFLLSLLVQLFLSLVWYFSGLAIGKPISPLYYFLYIPLINVITMVPITFGGLGIREGSFVYLFQRVGLTKEEAMGVSLLFLFANYLHSLIGGLIFITMKRGGEDA
ncbi:MAG: lysylphosphatidylglycerol synthase transmembrane domain-containing protein [candidate division WOR-3 bacterium]